MICDCEKCAAMPTCPLERLGRYGRSCWLALNEGRDVPDCAFFVERYWRGGESRRDWARARRQRRGELLLEK